MKKIVAALLCAALTFTSATAVFAAGNYTGWSIEGGSPRYYQNGVMLTNSWIKYGGVGHYVGADGYIVANRVVSLENLAPGYVDTDSASVTYEAAAAAAVPTASVQTIPALTAVQNDFDAFKVMHPDVVAQYAGNDAGLVGYYLSTYNGAAGSYYLDALARYGYGIYNTHHYTFGYEQMHDGTHKAYCACGEWIIETCVADKHASNGDYKCSRCGHHY